MEKQENEKPVIIDGTDTKDTYIKDSTVEIVIKNGANGSYGKKTDYWSLGIIVAIMIGLAIYGLIAKFKAVHNVAILGYKCVSALLA